MAAFVELLGKDLQTSTGTVETATALAGKTVGLYFSAHWCPPCRGFTPKLAEYYKLLKSQGKDLEIVFVSSDRDEGQFSEYFKEMPWLALPYALREKKAELGSKFKVQGIPMFVLLDSDAQLITAKGREEVSQDPTGSGWPYTPKPLREVLGPAFVDKSGNQVTLESLAGKTLALYFSASWCPPCRKFTPMLASVYEKFKSEGRTDFEVVYVSNDRDEASFNDYYGNHHPWLTIPYADRARMRALLSHFEVEGLPTLVVLDSELKTITNEGVQAVASDPEGADFPWHPKPLVDLSQGVSSNGYDINSKPALVAFGEALDDEEQGDLTAAMLALALEYAEEGKARPDGPRAIFFTCNTVTEMGGRIREMTKLGDVASNPNAKILLLDIADQGAYYHYTKGEDLSQAALKAFLDDYHNKKLARQQLGA